VGPDPDHPATRAGQLFCTQVEKRTYGKWDCPRLEHWLRERGQEVPPEDAKTHKMKMNGMVHEMIMPGMLNAEQLAALDRARGSDWDRLFLEAMIGHHAGAIDMVNKLMSSPGGATDDLVYRFSADVYADQTTEIERMQKMLAATPGAKP